MSKVGNGRIGNILKFVCYDGNEMETYLYIISNKTDVAKNLYKIGFHTGSKDKLIGRYKTYFRSDVLLLYLHAALPEDEKRILKSLSDIRRDGEWVQGNLKEIKKFIDGYFRNITSSNCFAFEKLSSLLDGRGVKLESSYKNNFQELEKLLEYEFLKSNYIYDKEKFIESYLRNLNEGRAKDASMWYKEDKILNIIKKITAKVCVFMNISKVSVSNIIMQKDNECSDRAIIMRLSRSIEERMEHEILLSEEIARRYSKRLRRIIEDFDTVDILINHENMRADYYRKASERLSYELIKECIPEYIDRLANWRKFLKVSIIDMHGYHSSVEDILNRYMIWYKSNIGEAKLSKATERELMLASIPKSELNTDGEIPLWLNKVSIWTDEDGAESSCS
ncbi:hypothetical protein BNJ_00196 [Kaumoebavirus]|uniref:hypothetical protein n=1 Tax=Kaumoebavirus TaxID=1859492 RepID=UPI0009C2AE0F|nr:hypothetical protein BNJ_00196 [Kaumoebavirus]ARA72027.1 hypothetical protein BNJ_00196 [Kaumoebavirus]